MNLFLPKLSSVVFLKLDEATVVLHPTCSFILHCAKRHIFTYSSFFLAHVFATKSC